MALVHTYNKFGPVEDQSFPYYVWTYIPNFTIIEFIDRCHDRSVPLNIACLTEPAFNTPPNHPLTGGWEDTEVNIVYGSYGKYDYEKEYYKNSDVAERMYPNRHFFPMYFLYHTFGEYTHYYMYPTYVEYQPDAYFTCYNRTVRPHRIILLQYLKEAGLLDYNYYSLVYNDYDAEEYSKSYKFDFKKANFDVKHPEGREEVNKNYYSHHESYTSSAFQLVTETTDDHIFLTEKTFYPILSRKPFIIFGAQHTNKVLKKFGFKLYTEVFDYSFDDIADTEVRAIAITKEVDRVTREYFPKQLYELMKETAEYNFRVAVNIVSKKKFIPKKFKEWDKLYQNNGIWTGHITMWYRMAFLHIDKYVEAIESYDKAITEESEGSLGEQTETETQP